MDHLIKAPSSHLPFLLEKKYIRALLAFSNTPFTFAYILHIPRNNVLKYFNNDKYIKSTKKPMNNFVIFLHIPIYSRLLFIY